ncbi:MAG: zinc metallopeptidase [Flavobacterium sp.]|nr:zinc metallopeptidase [Flavobacterium sp.]
MRWKGRRQSGNVDDRRGMSGGKMVAGGGIAGVIILLISIFLGGGDSGDLINGLQNQMQQGQQTERTTPLSAEEIEMREFVSVVLADTEDVWNKIFSQSGQQYVEPELVLFTDAVQTQCGGASSASGPFYCPADQKVYMDLRFFDELQSRFGAQGGDFAIAYVIAHEVGHHVQTLLGTSQKVQQLQSGMSKKEANKLLVALELQADFYAGVWTHHNEKMKSILDENDIEEALSAANAVGDDAIQRRTQGQVVPDSFTHGTSEQRMYWFNLGFKTGDVSRGNTFENLDAF